MKKSSYYNKDAVYFPLKIKQFCLSFVNKPKLSNTADL